ncbi:MAG: hypothetical protein GTO51_03825 [Candidatus Latescibacteria bacterium]|nr:hypothetical protein [Candidatus Latescibacterota bacterium]NIM20968.1 hypothetical protein [Candidatus Latescibacterota bacterium]NIM65103.1 hypothetical protein [Candidatus Latescibacterota bacterium]NIO01618.1 hypothetical protein [Candidatus Latescibacterota bacterium]NIO28135.1 hypothetical protein [Candidatus Latescibacterota bacterium]
MKCRRAKQLVFDFLDGTLAESDRVNLEKHLNECSTCETFTSQMARSLDLVHRAPLEAPSENFNWNVRLQLARERNAFHDAIAAQKEVFKSWNMHFALSAVATFALILASGYLLWTSGIILKPDVPAEVTYQRPATTIQNLASVPNETSTDESTTRYRGDLPDMQWPVSSGESGFLGRPGYRGAINEEVPPLSTIIMGPDSLVPFIMKSYYMQFRVRSLQQQVEQLQSYLRECESGTSSVKP